MLRRHLKWSPWLGVTVATLAVVFGVGSAHTVAQSDERQSLALSPATQQLTVEAGQTVRDTITVINNGSQATTVLVYARPYSVQTEQYSPDFQTTSPRTDVYRWLEFEETTFTLAPGEDIDVSYTMHVPADVAPGGHYGVIFVETQPEESADEAVIRKQRLGSILHVTVKGELVRQGQVLEMNVPFWQTTPPLVAQSRVQNNGNVDFQAHTTLTVSGVFGAVKHRSTSELIVYPDTTRQITLEWEHAPWFGLFKVDQTVEVLGETSHTSEYVLLAPRWLPLLLLVGLIIGAGYGLLRRRR